MKRNGGGFEPSYNVQISTDSTAGIIIGLDVTQSGADAFVNLIWSHFDQFIWPHFVRKFSFTAYAFIASKVFLKGSLERSPAPRCLRRD
jgi:hypothetical protein